MFISIYLHDVFLQFSERNVVVQHFKMGGRFFSPNGISNGEVSFIKFCSVADPGFEFFPSRIRIFSIPDPGSASKNLSILTQKMVSKLSEI
jgi:hypothetical protein